MSRIDDNVTLEDPIRFKGWVNRLKQAFNDHDDRLAVIEHEVTGSPVTSIDFSDLDINTDKSYRIEIDMVSVTSGSVLYLYYNNDTTTTNYYSQYVEGNGSTPGALRSNNAGIASFGVGTSSKVIAYVSLVKGVPICLSELMRDSGATLLVRTYGQSKTSGTLSNINQLTLTSSVGSTIDASTKVRIHRG